MGIHGFDFTVLASALVSFMQYATLLVPHVWLGHTVWHILKPFGGVYIVTVMAKYVSLCRCVASLKSVKHVSDSPLASLHSRSSLRRHLYDGGTAGTYDFPITTITQAVPNTSQWAFRLSHPLLIWHFLIILFTVPGLIPNGQQPKTYLLILLIVALHPRPVNPLFCIFIRTCKETVWYISVVN